MKDPILINTMGNRSMRTIFYTTGICLVALAFFLIIPALVETTLHTQDWKVFVITAVCALFLGGSLIIVNTSDRYTLSSKQAYLMTTVLWVVIPIFSGLPFYFTGTDYHLNFTDATFEAVSGMSTTGASVYSKLDTAPKGILLWRSLIVWIGGAGIIVLTMIMLPFLRIGGMQLFRTESSDQSRKILPKTHQIAAVTAASYVILSGLCALTYYIGGMTGFDAINHAMTTLATGGYATRDTSFTNFSPLIQWSSVFFMMVGGTPILLYYTFVTNRTVNRPLFYQTKIFWLQVFCVVIAVTLYVFYTSGMSFGTSLRLSAFNIVSIATTTGYVSTDYGQWGAFAIMIFYFLTIIGGCTGSTSGGIKTFRLVVMTQMVIYQIRKMLTPHGVFSAKMESTPIKDDLMLSVGIFFLLYVFVFVVLSLCVAVTGEDMLTSTSAVAQAMAGVGVGLGKVGPAYNFSALSDFAKWTLVVGMIVGRLEILTVMVLFSKNFWVR